MPEKKVKECLDRTTKSTRTKNKKRNRNGKSRTKRLEFFYDSERKSCCVCGNPNHLAHDCKKNKKDLKSAIKSKFNDSTAKIRNIPCFHCG